MPEDVPQRSRPRRPAFALVDVVNEQSPAEMAGMKVGDRIVIMGAVSLEAGGDSMGALRMLPGLLREHENRQVQVIVERDGPTGVEICELTLVPRRWSGTGVLGCHVVPWDGDGGVDRRYNPQVAVQDRATGADRIA